MIGPGIDYLVSDICLLSSLTKSELFRFAKDKTVVFAKRKKLEIFGTVIIAF